MKLDSLEKLYVHELKDLFSAENQILDALPSMIEAASDDGLKEALSSHMKETRGQVERLERIFEAMDFQPGGAHCKGMEGLIAEGKDLLDSDIEPEVLDAGIIGAAQRVEHYEIAGYGTAIAHASKLGDHASAELLRETLDEEGAADRTLTALAERHLNFEAMHA